ncbi:MAG: MarR family transcriptional regulator [Halanaerobiales bacterium]|nr:MarR family transcriptional regulator [Halanaerobiales bacterium]
MSEDLKLTPLEFEYLMTQIARIMNKLLRDSMKDATITPPQFSALITIYRDEDMTIGEISDVLFLANSTVSGLVDRLEKVDLVERYRDKADRRVVRVKLKEKGRRTVEEILEKRRKKLERDLGMLNSSQQNELLTDLTLLLKIMRKEES